MGDFRAFGGQGFVVEAFGAFGVEAEAELVAPAEFETRLAQGVVAQLCARPAFGEVGGVGGEFVGDDAGAHVFFVGQAEMLFRGNVAEHGCAVPADIGRAYARGDVVVAGGDVGNERAECVERRFKAVLQLFGHVFFDALQRYMAGAFDHDLYVVFPRFGSQFAQGVQFGELGFVVGIGNAAGAQAVAEAERHIVGFHDFADFVEMRVEEVFLVVGETPFRHDGAAARYDAGEAVGGHRHITQQHACVYGEIVHALFRLFD